MRRVLTLAVVALALALLPWSVGAGSPAGASALATTVIRFPVSGPFYSPSVVLVNVGDTVQWDGSFSSHPLVSDDNLWPEQNAGRSFSFTFQQPGTFRYYCKYHGAAGGGGMSGMVIVTADPIRTLYIPVVLR